MISFDQDPVVTDSLQQWRGREVFPTDLGSADLRGFSRQLRERSVFSARTTNADYLDEVSGTLDDMLSGKINLATGRWKLMRKLKELGYDPEVGFPQDMANVPPAERGSLQDLSSERRIDLMLKTNLAMARNFGRLKAGNTEFARFAWPAWELVRLELRDVPRGAPDSHSVGWQRRWTDAGASVDWEGAVGGKDEGGRMKDEGAEQPETRNRKPGTGRMMALKDSPIWEALADGAGGYTDTLGHPYPPFAFNSGMDWRAVPRAEWLEESGKANVESGTDMPAETNASFAPTKSEAAAAFARLSPDLKAVLKTRWAE